MPDGKASSPKNRASGFTLIELMLVVVIVAILAAIAYPSYRDHVIRTNRSDAQIALTQAANQQERFFTECNRYARNLTGTRGCGDGENDGVLGLSSNLSPERHYVISIVPPTDECPITRCYVMQAVPATTAQGGTGQQLNDGGFRIDSRGLKQWDKANDGSYNAKWTDR